MNKKELVKTKYSKLCSIIAHIDMGNLSSDLSYNERTERPFDIAETISRFQLDLRF